MVPEVGCSKPERIFISVDLPAPFSPMMACTSPGRTSKSIENSTGISPNDFEIRLAESIGVAVAASAPDIRAVPPAARCLFPAFFPSTLGVKVFMLHVKVYISPQTYRFAPASRRAAPPIVPRGADSAATEVGHDRGCRRACRRLDRDRQPGDQRTGQGRRCHPS